MVSVNPAAKLVFLIKGVNIRAWLEKRKVRQSLALDIVLWPITLAMLVAATCLPRPARAFDAWQGRRGANALPMAAAWRMAAARDPLAPPAGIERPGNPQMYSNTLTIFCTP